MTDASLRWAASGHRWPPDVSIDDLITVDRDMAHLSGVTYGGEVLR